MYRLILFLLAFTPSTWSFTQTNFSAEELQADAKLLWQVLNELHPGLYRHSDTITLTKSYQQLLKDFSVGKSEEEAFLGLTQFAAKVKCGHTFVSPFNQMF